jgi:hypothetical protein
MSNAKKVQDFLKDFEDVPEEITKAAGNLKDTMASRGLKGAFVDKDGRFSTMRSANFLANMMFILVFLVLAFTSGNTIDLGLFKDGLTLPEFPAAGAGALALILNGTYAYKHKTNVENGH